MTRLALLRHGHTTWNREGRIQGCSDIALDAEARKVLANLCLPLPWKHADLWSSPLVRAIDTAMLVADREPRTSPALTEMDWGSWEGQHGVDLRADPHSGFRDIEEWGWDYRPPGGESPQEVWDRIAPWLSSLTHDAVAVCHIGVMRMILAKATGWNFGGPPPFQIKRYRLYILELEPCLKPARPDIVRLEVRGS